MKPIAKIILAIITIIMLISMYHYIKGRNANKNELTLYGNIEIRQVDLGFRIDGKIEKMLYEEGDTVKKGDLIAYLDNKQYKSTYEKALAEIELNRSANKNAASKYERNRPLCYENTISKQECDDLFNSKNETKAALDASIANAKYAKNNVDDSMIYAPCDGIVMTRVQEPGSIAIPGQPIYTISKNKPIWIRAYVPETELGNIRYGMKTKVLTDTINPKTGKPREYTGWIGYISPVAEFTPKTVQTTELRTDLVYRIRVYVYELDEYLRQGMPVTINIDLLNKETKERVKEDYDE